MLHGNHVSYGSEYACVHKDQEVDWDLPPAIRHGWTSRQDAAHARRFMH